MRSTSKRQLRERAHELLEWLLFWWMDAFQDLYAFRSAEVKHFKGDSIGRIVERNLIRRRGTDVRPSRTKNRQLDEQGRFHGAFCEILLAAARNEKISAEGLSLLQEARNLSCGRIKFLDVALDHAENLNRVLGVGGPYFPADDSIRIVADTLIHYLNVTYFSGPVHSICSVCGGLMKTARGRARTVCSATCRKEKYGTAYFTQKQRDRRAAKNALARGKKRK